MDLQRHTLWAKRSCWVDRTRAAASGEETDALVNARCIVACVLKGIQGN
jgi:hypothetical protein